MKSLFATILFGFLAIPALQAQSAKGLGTSDPEAKKVLDAVSAKFKTYKTVKAGFNLKVESNGKVQGTKTGTVYMKGAKYRVAMGEQDIFCDGKNIWTYDKGSNEVQITQYDPSSNAITPQKLFTNFYDKDFLYKLNGDKKEGTATVQEIELTPVDKSKPFFKVYVNVNKTTRNISSTRVMEKNGNKYTYSVTSFTPNGDVPDATFVFDAKKYPGVEVIDLR
jgi:outer membrane lipoprotein carrier protein